MIGLSGASGSGKTTLAKIFSEKYAVDFIPSEADRIHRDFGVTPADIIDLDLRIDIQHEILKTAVDSYQVQTTLFVTDRTPLDFAAYLLSDVKRSNVLPEQERRILSYVRTCQEVTNQYFASIVLVPPSIEYDEEHRVRPCSSYNEAFHHLLSGILVDTPIAYRKCMISRHVTDIDKRLEILYGVYNELIKVVSDSRNDCRLH